MGLILYPLFLIAARIAGTILLAMLALAAIAGLAAGAAVWILCKLPRPSVTGRRAAALLLAALVYLSPVGAAVWFTHLPPVPFDSAQWKARPSQRWRMEESLIDSGLLEGQSRRDLHRLLGPPSDEWRFGSGGRDVWILNPYTISPDLVVTYDESGTVEMINPPDEDD